MNIEILPSMPDSGSFPEKHFGNTTSACLWLKFTGDSDEIWIGSFAGDKITEGIKIENHGDEVALLYNGNFYLIDIIKQEEILNLKNNGDYIDFINTPSRQFMCLARLTSIEIYKEFKRLKRIKPDSIDGIKFETASETEIKGKIFDPDWIDGSWSDFKLDLNKLELYWQGLTFGYRENLDN